MSSYSGGGGGAELSDVIPQAAGLVSVAGSGSKAARDDHEHVGMVRPGLDEGAGGAEEVYVLPGWIIRTLSVASVSANEMYSCPIYVAKRWTFSALKCKVTTERPDSAARLGIYAAVANNAGLAAGGGALVLDAGTVSCVSSGEKEIVTEVTLDPGWYFLVLVADDGGLSFESAHTSTEGSPVSGKPDTGFAVLKNATFYTSAGVMGTPVADGLPDPHPNTSGYYAPFKAAYVRLKVKATL